jgi:GNAT superfamily N-acetyltransferase
LRIVDYDPSRRSLISDFAERATGRRRAEAEFEWFYERNPVRPSIALQAVEDGEVVGLAALSFVRMLIEGEEQEIAMPVHVATHPAYRERGIFSALETENERRARELGIRLMLTVPNSSSGPIFLRRLGWTTLEPLRLWAAVPTTRWRSRAARVERFGPIPGTAAARTALIRDDAWLNWRFGEAPRPYTLLQNGGHAVLGRRGRFGLLLVAGGDVLRDAVAAARRPLVASPPPAERARYLRAGFLPAPRTLNVIGKALDPAQPLPAKPHFELGDLDFV